MKKQLQILALIALFSALMACGGENSSEQSPIISFESETIYIEDNHPTIDSIAFDIMDKMQICTLSDTLLSLPPCDAKYFQVFQYQKDKKWKDGFIVEMVPGVYGAPVHQLVIVQNHLGKYRILNRYLGELMEMRTTIDGYHDLLVGYDDPDIGRVAIRHEWQGKKYDVVDVEEINDHFVRPEMKDSINAIFLPAFSGGY